MKGNRLSPRRVALYVLIGALALPVAVASYHSVVSSGAFTLAAIAPADAGGMTVAVAVPSSLLRETTGTATYQIKHNGVVVYPPTGAGAPFPVKDGRGSAFIPYSIFVVGNGDYEVVVRFGDTEQRATASVTKWVNYVFMLPFERNHGVALDVVLGRSPGGGPAERVQAAGDLLVDVRYRGSDGRMNVPLPRLKFAVSGESPLERVEVPASVFSRGAGYYSFDATFFNDQAFGNNGARTDPTLANTSPPRNWVYWGG